MGDHKHTDDCLPPPPRVPLNWWLRWPSFDQSSVGTHTASSCIHHQLGTSLVPRETTEPRHPAN